MDKLTETQLELYLQHIGIKENFSADAVGLTLLQKAHRHTIPFENIDVLLDRTISLDLLNIFAKLILNQRGGYCFEQNSLFLAALHGLGFTARPLLARVWYGAGDGIPPRTHTFNLVTLPDSKWIADAGFGAGYSPPMQLIEHEIVTDDGATHALRRDADFGWMLERNHAPQYSFSEDTVFPNDLAQANHWTNRSPLSKFRHNLITSLATPHGLRALTLPVSENEKQGSNTISTSEITEILAQNFHIHITADEVHILPSLINSHKKDPPGMDRNPAD